MRRSFRLLRCCARWYASPQELKGKFLIKGKRLNKLEVSFAGDAAAAENTDVTEEEESNDEDEQKQKKSKVSVTSSVCTRIGASNKLLMFLLG